jgi:hypothetical protein
LSSSAHCRLPSIIHHYGRVKEKGRYREHASPSRLLNPGRLRNKCARLPKSDLPSRYTQLRRKDLHPSISDQYSSSRHRNSSWPHRSISKPRSRNDLHPSNSDLYSSSRHRNTSWQHRSISKPRSRNDLHPSNSDRYSNSRHRNTSWQHHNIGKPRSRNDPHPSNSDRYSNSRHRNTSWQHHNISKPRSRNDPHLSNSDRLLSNIRRHKPSPNKSARPSNSQGRRTLIPSNTKRRGNGVLTWLMETADLERSPVSLYAPFLASINL